MKKIYIVLGILLVVLIISIMVISFQKNVSYSITKNGDSLPMIDSILEKKYIKREEGIDEDGNFYIILHYDPKDVDEEDINGFETLLNEDYEFYASDEENFEEGQLFVGTSNEKGKEWVITIYHV